MIALDYLRGFFILVIIIDHVSRWPSLMIIFSGKAFLWATAAEGFVLISGLLVGYIRGYKSKHKSIKEPSIVLIKRAFKLYAWAALANFIYTLAIWYLPLVGGSPGSKVASGDYVQLAIDSIMLQNISPWIYFLKIYAVYLLVAPVIIYMLKKGYSRLTLLIVFIVYSFGLILGNELMQWQLLFFGAAIAGYHLDMIKRRFHSLKSNRQKLTKLIIYSAFIGTLSLSIVATFFHNWLPDGVANNLNNLFPKETITPLRSLVAGLWFLGFVIIFIDFKPFIKKTFGWLLEPFGKQSLRAYIIHGAALIIVSYFFPPSENIWINTILSLIAIMLVWLALKSRVIQKLIPS